MSRLGRTHPAGHILLPAINIADIYDNDACSSLEQYIETITYSQDFSSSLDLEFSNVDILISDLGNLIDSQSVSSLITDSDSFSSNDINNLYLISSDNPLSSESSSINNSFSSNDFLTSLESIILENTDSDSFLGSDIGNWGLPIFDTDSFSGSDSSTTIATIPSTEIGHGNELILVYDSSLIDQDYVSFLELNTIKNIYSDIISSIDSFTLLPISLDFFISNDINTNTFVYISGDSGLLNDSQLVISYLSDSDNFSSIESNSNNSLIYSSDNISSIDFGSANQGNIQKNDSDSYIGIDSFYSSLVSISSMESAVANDLYDTLFTSSDIFFDSLEINIITVHSQDNIYSTDIGINIANISSNDSMVSLDTSNPIIVIINDSDRIQSSEFNFVEILQSEFVLLLDTQNLQNAPINSSDVSYFSENQKVLQTIGNNISIYWNIYKYLNYPILSSSFVKNNIISSSNIIGG